MSQHPPKEWFTTKEAAAFLGIHRQTLWQHTRRGLIAHHVSPSGTKRYRLLDLLEYRYGERVEAAR